MSDVAKEIFKEIEQAIIDSISDKPVSIQHSRFIEKLKKIKEKYCDGQEPSSERSDKKKEL